MPKVEEESISTLEKNEEESEKKKSSWKKLVIQLKKWVESPFFILHFVRIAMLFWIYLFQNYFSFLLLLL